MPWPAIMNIQCHMFFLSVGIACLSGLAWSQLKKKPTSVPLPPGPNPLPIFGNLTDFPKALPWMTFAHWGEIYGGIVRVTALGKSIIILNDAQHAINMLNKKSTIYSERPKLVFSGQLIGWEQSMALVPTGSLLFSACRQLFAQFLGSQAKVKALEPVLVGERNYFLKRILADPSSWMKHSYTYADALLLMLAYGYKSTDDNGRILKVIKEGMVQFSETTENNDYIVNTLPFLRYVPGWFPGAAWKRKIPMYRSTLKDMLNLPYEWTKQQTALGTGRSCFVSKSIGEIETSVENELAIKWSANGIYTGGCDTIVGGIKSFFLAMALHMPAQIRAQSEIDRVIGYGRLPTLADRPRLPYVEAVFLEVIRMYPFAPIGLPHVLSEDDIHGGYFIPKDSIILSNIWQFFRDSSKYKNPELFSPERFIASSKLAPEMDPRGYQYGFGRRVCPGMHLADASIWLLCASVLATFDVRAPVKNGKFAFPSGKFMDGTISHPEPFECSVMPRSMAAQGLVATS